MMNPRDDRAIAAPSHMPPRASQLRASRWIVIATVPLLLLLMLVMSMQNWSVAQAADGVTVGTCTGSQDHATIQDAVNTGGSAIINICPGIYSESVNLSLLDGGLMGNITLRKVPGAVGDVNINPTVGSAIWISPGIEFIGNITIISIRTSTNDGSGIDFGSSMEADERRVGGSVVLSDVVAADNSEWGTIIGATGAVTVENSDFSGNNYGHEGFTYSGLEIHISQVIDTVVAVDATDANIYLNNVTSNENEMNGIYIYSEDGRTVQVFNTEANGNGDEEEAYDHGDGIYIEHYPENTCIEYQATEEETVPFVQLESVSANDNQRAGISVYSNSDVFINDAEVINNPLDGLRVDTRNRCIDIRVELADSYAEANGWGDVIVFGVEGDIEVQNGDDPSYGGFRLLSSGTAWVGEGTTAVENTGFGFCLANDLKTVVHDALAENNLGDGFSYGFGCFELSRALASEQESAQVGPEQTFEANDIGVAPGLVISNTSAISNGGTGFLVMVPDVPITYTNISALRNVTGVAFIPPDMSNGIGRLGINDVSIQDSHTGGSTLIYNSLIQSNTALGLFYQQEVETVGDASIQVTIPPTSTNFVHSSIVCENGVGLRAEQRGSFQQVTSQENGDHLLNVDARGNWWGSDSGPDAPGNEEGTGDSIETEALINGPASIAANDVIVEFDPWINTLHATAVPSPTVAGVPVALEYQFSDGSLAYYLENGVGDPNNGPLFLLSATNGVIEGDPNKFIASTYITGTATPATPGTMGVQLSGPCGLSPTLNVPVATPDIAISKSPATQVVPTGQSAAFTISVQNVGNIALTDIEVTDPLAPNCARAIGDVDDLGVGDSMTYTCSLSEVNENFVNRVTASGVALLAGEPAGAPVTATATAEVSVASFTLTKAAYVAGYNEWIEGDESDPVFSSSECALESEITVPVSSTVKYCYTITNTGSYTLSTHTLVDDHTGTILTNFPREVGPGQSFSTVDVGINVTSTLYVSTINTATWTAEATTQEVAVPAITAVNATVPVVATAVATVNISTPELDQDGDGIPDNEEQTGDANSNGIPDYLDPAMPTNEPPTQQPSPPTENGIYLPSLGNN